MRRLVWLVIVALASTPAAVQGQVRLDWKLQAGDRFFLETVHATRQGLTFLGRQVRQDVQFSRVSRLEVVKQDAAGVVLRQRIERVAVKPAEPETPDLGKFLQQLEGAAFTIHLDRAMRVTRLEGYDEMLKKLAGDNAVLRKTLGALLNEDKLREEMGSLFSLVLPEGEVRDGARWQGEARHSLGLYGSFAGKGEHVYASLPGQGAGRPLGRIDVVWAMNYFPPKEQSPEAPFQVVKGALSLNPARGFYVFDVAAGRVVHCESTMVIKGTLAVASGGREVALELEQETTARSRLLDRDPLAKEGRDRDPARPGQ